VHSFVVKLTDLSFLSDEDLAAHGDLGGKIIRQFSFLPGDLKVTISDGLAHIEYSPAPPDKLAEALRLADQGANAAKKGDFHSALDFYTAALQANPALPDTRRDLAMVHYEIGQLDAAKDELIDALRLAPDDAWSHVVMGNILTRQQDWTSTKRSPLLMPPSPRIPKCPSPASEKPSRFRGRADSTQPPPHLSHPSFLGGEFFPPYLPGEVDPSQFYSQRCD
jgi:tetratricopeptide (TPR) repeat protein